MTADQLWLWVRSFTGVSIPRQHVCEEHTAPFDLFARQFLERPSLALWHGPRGSGKSFLSAIETHLNSRFTARHETKILGGSLAQSHQIYHALTEAIVDGRGVLGGDSSSLERLAKTEGRYRNGSTVSILAASPTSVRGPHVPSLKLDEVDEIEPDIRESAMGMAMEKRGVRSSVLMTSTWHRVAGPMATLMDRGKAGAFPVDSYCMFEVLETCPEERSGPGLELCPGCPIVGWCHSDRDRDPLQRPKAKRSAGHYAIDSLIQKAKSVSPRVFESDYLCLRPKVAGIWFATFDESIHLKTSAEYDARFPVHVSIDSGVHTGAVWFQVRPNVRGNGQVVAVFADYFAEGLAAEVNARAIVERTRELCGGIGPRTRVSTDPAGNARTAIGPTVRGEYERGGLRAKNGLESWPGGKKADGLQLVEALLLSADKSVSLTIHPRCLRLITALQSYARARRGNQWMDYAEDPQHPHEDMVDPLCGGLKLEFPDGRAPAPALRTVAASRMF
ncbi:MAG: hypothetical protein ACYDCI_00090 [Candidatus Limnocylindrales bacterium]